MRRLRASSRPVHLHESNARMVVNGYARHLPTNPAGVVTGVARDAMARSSDAPEFLHGHVQQIARCLVFVAHRRLLGIERLEAGQALLCQHAADGGDAAAHDLGNTAHSHVFAPKAFDALRQFSSDGAACSQRSGCPLSQALHAESFETITPFAGCAQASAP